VNKQEERGDGWGSYLVLHVGDDEVVKEFRGEGHDVLLVDQLVDQLQRALTDRHVTVLSVAEGCGYV